MKRLAQKIVWLIVLPGLLLEAGARLFPPPPTWYEAAMARGETRPKVILIGDSRLGRAVTAEVMKEELSAQGFGERAVYNLARGGATPVLHWLALRDWLRRDAGALRGAQLLIQTVEGVPDFQKWTDPWISEAPAMLPPLLRAEDWPRFWLSGDSLEQKTATLIAKASRAQRSVMRWRENLALAAEGAINKMVLLPLPTRELAGTRGDSFGLRRARLYAEVRQEEWEEAARAQQPFRDWDALVVRDIVKLGFASGAKVEFVSVPVSSLRAQSVRSPAGLQDREVFREVAQSWGSVSRLVPFAREDKDFPDYMHLSRKLAPEYTKALVSVLSRD